MSTIRSLLPHPIIFIMDFSSDRVEVPDFDPEKVAWGNRTCVSVRTIADCDGEVTVTLVDSIPATADPEIEIFAGTVEAPSGQIAVVTSDLEKLLECKIDGTEADVHIFVDDRTHPSAVWISTSRADSW